MGDPRWGATGAMLQLTPTSARISCAKSESGIEAVRSESLCDLPDLASSQPASPRQPTPPGSPKLARSYMSPATIEAPELLLPAKWAIRVQNQDRRGQVGLRKV